MSNETTTPRTDAVISDAWTMCGIHIVSADFARMLERELTAKVPADVAGLVKRLLGYSPDDRQHRLAIDKDMRQAAAALKTLARELAIQDDAKNILTRERDELRDTIYDPVKLWVNHIRGIIKLPIESMEYEWRQRAEKAEAELKHQNEANDMLAKERDAFREKLVEQCTQTLPAIRRRSREACCV